MTDTSIISICTHCTRLQSLYLEECEVITDASIIMISIHCTGLRSLNLHGLTPSLRSTKKFPPEIIIIYRN